MIVVAPSESASSSAARTLRDRLQLGVDGANAVGLASRDGHLRPLTKAVRHSAVVTGRRSDPVRLVGVTGRPLDVTEALPDERAALVHPRTPCGRKPLFARKA